MENFPILQGLKKPVEIKKTDSLPNDFFRQDVSVDFVLNCYQWAVNPENQTLEKLQDAGIYYPLIRKIWEDMGLIEIVD